MVEFGKRHLDLAQALLDVLRQVVGTRMAFFDTRKLGVERVVLGLLCAGEWDRIATQLSQAEDVTVERRRILGDLDERIVDYGGPVERARHLPARIAHPVARDPHHRADQLVVPNTAVIGIGYRAQLDTAHLHRRWRCCEVGGIDLRQVAIDARLELGHATLHLGRCEVLVVLRPDPSRTVVRPFEPSYLRGFDDGTSRTQEVIDHIVDLGDAELDWQLTGVTETLDENHRDVDATLLRRFGEMADRIPGSDRLNGG